MNTNPPQSRRQRRISSAVLRTLGRVLLCPATPLLVSFVAVGALAVAFGMIS